MMKIPGQALEIRYRRSTDGRRYVHRFTQPVQMRANRNGTVTLAGRHRIHAHDAEPGFDRYRKNPSSRPRRYRIEQSRHLPAGAFNRYHVYDFQTGMIARREDGSLAYFPRRSDAVRWVQAHEDHVNPSRRRRSSTVEGGGLSLGILALGGLALWWLSQPRAPAPQPAGSAAPTGIWGSVTAALSPLLGEGASQAGQGIAAWIRGWGDPVVTGVTPTIDPAVNAAGWEAMFGEVPEIPDVENPWADVESWWTW